jgi:hypothetical protein
MSNESKLAELAEIEGMDSMDLIEECVMDSVVIGICTNPGCDYTCGVEPDQEHGHCSVCLTQTVASALVLAGMA